ncbi:MAG: phosphoribosylamine--glycine ligase [Candidatus Cloacimonetes bacterium]|nr:phosphoribosylamine--glycine ligase [Candidatus Cloacimonadota bacterium]
MKVLIIGSGGREHALAEAFARSNKISKVTVAPGNAGIARQYPCEELFSHSEILEYCLREKIDLVFIGPEQAIADGLSDYLRLHKIAVIAPSMMAAKLESSKIFAKLLMNFHNIPTAQFRSCGNKEEALIAIMQFGFPVVIKADGLAAGKGVIIVHDPDEASLALHNLLPENGDGRIVIEEFLQGWEVSLFAICDGQSYVSTVFAQDHKQLYDYDEGPNTGGMGAYAPVPEAEKYRKEIEERIISPTLNAMRELGYPYEGILYCGLMITKDGPKVIEFNCRLGDPEAQVVLPLLKTDFALLCEAIITKKIHEIKLEFDSQTALGVVLAAPGYPGKYPQGMPITSPAELPEGVYFSGVGKAEGSLICSGGRVLSLVGKGRDLNTARSTAYLKLKEFSFEGMTYRNDIGLRHNTL